MKKRAKSQELIKERNDKIKQFLKDMIAPTIFLVIVGFVLYKMATYVKPVAENDIPEAYGFDGNTDPVVMENEYLKFDMDPETTMFTITQKSTGTVWSSNPDLSLETLALSDEKSKLSSLLSLQYSSEQGKGLEFDSYSKSVEKQIYSIDRGTDSVTVHFSIGDVEKQYLIPPVLLKEEMDDYLARIEEASGKKISQEVLNRYKKLDINKLSSADAGKKDEYLERYPEFADNLIYILRDNLNATMKIKIERAFESVGYDHEQYEKDVLRDTQAAVSDKPIFNVDLVFKLDGDKLRVSVPFSSIQNPAKNPILYLTVLPYFGAGAPNEEGYMLVPEGGGALINFNNGKYNVPAYNSRVYGWDTCLIRNSVVHDPISNFGVFGVAKENGSFICVTEDGSSYCTIQADVSGRTNSFNYVNTKYNIYQREQYDAGSTSNFEIFKYIEELPQDEKLEQVYIFSESNDYVELAKLYEKFLKDKYGESYFRMNSDTSTPVNIELIGAVDKTEQILGVPVSRPLELTNFDEAGEIADELSSNGFKNVSFKYTGWCNGGVNQTVLSKAKPVSRLGGKSDLKKFSEKASSLGYKLALNGITNLALDSNIFDGFFSFTDAAKNISSERMELHKYSSVTYALREGSETFYLLHASTILEYADNLVEAADEYNAGASFDDIGKDIASDFYKKDTHSRENVRKNHTELLKKYADAGKYTVINAGNEYAIPYVDLITNMDLSGSNYTILDYNIPFLELAIHGYKNYTGESLNICGDIETELLYSAAYGAGLSFTVMKESPFTLQDTLYTHYYGCDYDAWKSNMIEIYNRYNNELGHIFNRFVHIFEFFDRGECRNSRA